MKTAAVAACVLSVAASAACSSEGDILPKRERFTPSFPDAEIRLDAGVGDVTPDVAGDGRKPRDPQANCVKPGTPSNERGIGGYCELGTGECATDQGPRFCTADLGEVAVIDENAWFCTTICTMDEDCGSGVLCVASPAGSGCVPVTCIPDAGAHP